MDWNVQKSHISSTLWFQLEDMFQLIGTPQGIERVLFQIKVTPQCFEKYRVKYKAWDKFDNAQSNYKTCPQNEFV